MEKKQKIKIGQTYTYTLEGNASTGYEWVVASKVPNSVSIELKVAAISGNVVGGSTRYTFSIKGILKGKAQLVFHYKRAWEKDIEPTRVEVLNIEIL